VYKQLADCPARQKVLVLDGNRYNAAQGEERPAAGPMEAKFEEKLKAPPEGVQVWVSCSSTQQSQEFEEAPLGLFLDSFRLALTPEKGYKGALEGKIQKPDDLIALDTFNATVTANMNRELERRRLTQVPKAYGKPPAGGAEYDRGEALAKAPTFPVFKSASQEAVKAILAEISLPSVKGSTGTGADVNFSSLPPFAPETLKKYEGSLAEDSKLRKAIQSARATLWAVSNATAPPQLQADVAAVRQKLKVDLSIMKDKYPKPGEGAAETQFKNRVFNDSKEMSRIIAVLEDGLDQLKEAGAEMEMVPLRWQVNYTYILARLQAQLTYLEEYQSLLGQMRKEYPQHDPAVHTGFRMAAKEKASDSAAKKYFKALRAGYNDLATKHKGTPWEVLGKREELTALGLEWQPY
jgi:hypothetical protein